MAVWGHRRSQPAAAWGDSELGARPNARVSGGASGARPAKQTGPTAETKHRSPVVPASPPAAARATVALPKSASAHTSWQGPRAARRHHHRSRWPRSLSEAAPQAGGGPSGQARYITRPKSEAMSESH